MSKTMEIGTEIQYKDGQGNWITAKINKISQHYVWFSGAGYERIKITTFDNHPELYRIKK